MATTRWTGGAGPVAQVTTLTVGGTVEAGDKFIVTINGKSITTTASSTSTTTTASEVALALQNNVNGYPEFQEVTAQASGSTVTLTANTKGKPFTATPTTTEGDGSAADSQTFSGSTTTANAGPNDWSTAANWSGGAVPANSDDVYIENSNISILYGLDQSAVTLTSLTVAASFTGQIGLPERAGGGYQEYRDTYLKVGATTLNVGQGSGQGSGRIKINLGAVQYAGNVYGTGSSVEQGVEALQLLGTHVSNVLNVFKGSVGVGVRAGDAPKIATLRVAYTNNPAGDAQVRIGSGATLTTINQTGGTLEINSAVVTVNKTAGTLTVGGAATCTTLNEEGGTTYYNSSGTCTTANVSNATLDFGRVQVARTVTNCNLFAKAIMLDPGETVTWTNPFLLSRCGLAPIDPDGVTLDLGSHFSLARS